MPAGSRAGDITKRLSEMWNSLSYEEQAQYNEEEDKEDEEDDCDE